MFIFPDQTEERYSLAMTDFCVCALLALIVIVLFVYGLYLIIKKRDKEAFILINKDEKKFEPSILIADGICSGVLIDLIFIKIHI